MSEKEIDQRTDKQKMNAWVAEHVFKWEWRLTGNDPVEDGYCWHNEKGEHPCNLPDFFEQPHFTLALLIKCFERAKSHFGEAVVCEDTMAGYTMYLMGKSQNDRITQTSFYWPTTVVLFAKSLFSTT